MTFLCTIYRYRKSMQNFQFQIKTTTEKLKYSTYRNETNETYIHASVTVKNKQSKEKNMSKNRRKCS